MEFPAKDLETQIATMFSVVSIGKDALEKDLPLKEFMGILSKILMEMKTQYESQNLSDSTPPTKH